MKDDNIENYPDRITKLFVGKNIFVTGGSGFIGKVFIEKIIRECPDIGSFYLLIRDKRGKCPETRLKEIFSNPLFDKVKSMHGEDIMERKCKPINGDVSEINLGISPNDREFLTENIHYIYHAAASVKFDEPLKTSLFLNTRGTREVLQLANDCKILEFICYVSTSYVCPEITLLEEKIYDSPVDPHKIIKSIEKLPGETVDALEPKILGNKPNTYTFTKVLSETLVKEQFNKLPIVIFRPSVVVPIWKAPLPGWCDNVNGPVGLMIGAGKGVVRTMYCNKNYYADFVPVDIIANCLAIVTWDFLTTRENRIFNITSSDEIQVTWQECIDIGKKIVEEKLPFNSIPWYPGGSCKRSKFLHFIAFIFTQLLPAIFVDSLIFCFGYKPVLCHIQRKILKGYTLLEHYANNQWLFIKENLQQARSRMNPRERKIYCCDKDDLVIENFFYDLIRGARLYILKESDESIPAAKRHTKIMWYVDVIFKGILMFASIYILYKCFL